MLIAKYPTAPEAVLADIVEQYSIDAGVGLELALCVKLKVCTIVGLATCEFVGSVDGPAAVGTDV